MDPKSQSSSPAIAALTLFAATVLLTSWQAVAQSPPAKPATTWQDLGFSQMPEGFPTDKIPLFEGLDEARGTWNLENRTIIWTERDLPAGLRGQAAAEEKDPSKPTQTFEMVVAADGKISIQNSKHAPHGQMTTGQTFTPIAHQSALIPIP